MYLITKHKKQVFAVLLLAASACFFSCKKKTNTPTPATVRQLPDVVSFSNHIIPIFNASCISGGCHSGGSAAAGLNLSASVAYSQLFSKHEIDTVNVNSSNLYIEVASGAMPKGTSKLSDYNISIIQKWIQQKAKNN
jgi:hypothetical protein